MVVGVIGEISERCYERCSWIMDLSGTTCATDEADVSIVVVSIGNIVDGSKGGDFNDHSTRA